MLKGKVHTIYFYADDVLLYLVEIDTAIACLLGCLQQPGHISGFKVNLLKMEAMPLVQWRALLHLVSFLFIGHIRR